MRKSASYAGNWQDGWIRFDSLHPLQLRFAAGILLHLAPVNGFAACARLTGAVKPPKGFAQQLPDNTRFSRRQHSLNQRSASMNSVVPKK
jgi:hypothetical protein